VLEVETVMRRGLVVPAALGAVALAALAQAVMISVK
jgi:hypothetical protein